MLLRKKIFYKYALLPLLWVPYLSATAQQAATHVRTSKAANTENALLWEISGKNLRQASYLFGTFHLITSDYLKSLPLVDEKLLAAQAVVGEMVMDSTVMMKLMPASMMTGTTLKQLLKPEDYQLVADYLKEVSGLELFMLGSLKPMALQAALMQFEWNKLNPQPVDAGQPMDIYFQRIAKEQGKKVLGLEKVEDQVKALFDQFPLKRQAEMLVESVKDKKKNSDDMQKLAECYRAQDLACLRQMMYGVDTFTPAEMKILLDDRNEEWARKMPDLMQQQATFFAVGAGHLVGEHGLVSLLRRQGYTVRPVKAKS
jgi:uncharacterized protein